MDWLDSDHVTRVYCDACPFLGYISKSRRVQRNYEPVVAAEAGEQEDSNKLEEQTSSKLEECRRVQEVGL
jgi:hypothetical protein